MLNVISRWLAVDPHGSFLPSQAADLWGALLPTKRRLVLSAKGVFWRLVVLMVLLAAGAPPAGNGVGVANRFAEEYNVWAGLRNERMGRIGGEGMLDVGEVLQWKKVKSAWRRVEKEVDGEYRGER